MADLISEIVSQEAFDQVKELTAQMQVLYNITDKVIALAAGNNKVIDTNSVKGANDAVENYNKTQQKLIETESERLTIETKLKENEAKMAASITVSSKAVDEAKRIWKAFALGNEELADRIAEATIKLEEQKQKLKDAKNATNYKQVLAQTTVETAKLKAEISEYTKEMKRNIQQMDVSEDSVKYMSVLLAQATDQWSKLSEQERNSDFGVQFTASINELDAKLKGLEGSVGNYKRMVGGYLITGESMRSQLREIIQALAEEKLKMDGASDAIRAQEAEVKRLANTVGVNSSEYQESKVKLDGMKLGLQQATAAMTELEKEGGKIQDAMGDARTAIKGMADDAGNSKAVAEGVGVLANSFQVFQAGMAAVGLEGEDMMKVYAKMMILQQGFNSLTQITNALQSESVLRLKLKNIWDKASLVFTQKKTSATIQAAAATGGLAAAEGVATTTSWTLAGSIKAVGAAIKSIPVVGWILAAVAALATLTVLLYKHISAEKEMTAEQVKRKQLAKDLTEINQKTNESTLENVTRVKLLQKELVKVAKGSKEYQSIVKEINTLTGSQFDTIKATPAEIAKGTAAWVQQYKIRAKAEATIQKIVENELEFEKLRNEYFQSGTAPDRRREIAEQLKMYGLTKDQVDDLVQSTNKYKDATTSDKKGFFNQSKSYWDTAKKGMQSVNDGLEKQITLEGMLSDGKGGTNKVTTEKAVTKEKFDQLKLERLLIELRLTGVEQEEALRSSKINQLKKDKALAIAADPKNEVEITKQYALEMEKVWNEHAVNIATIQKKITEDQTKTTTDRVEILEVLIDRTYSYIDAINALAAAEGKMNEGDKEKANQLLKDRISATGDMAIQFGELGKAITQNIKDEKERIKIEQRIAEVQVAINGAIAISQILIDKGDSYTKAVRIIANLAAVTTGIIAAENAIKQANSVSTYAEGTDYHKGGAALMGEGVKNNQYQPELLTIGGKSTWITEPTYFPNLPVGAQVTPLSDMKQESNMNDIWLEKLYNKQGGNVQIDVSGNLMARFKTDSKSLHFANKLFYIKN
jgi:hypothetical protein